MRVGGEWVEWNCGWDAFMQYSIADNSREILINFYYQQKSNFSTKHFPFIFMLSFPHRKAYDCLLCFSIKSRKLIAKTEEGSP